VREKQEGIKRIEKEILLCRKCPLYQEREKNNYLPVIGEGNLEAKAIFIGEAPGLNEAKSGRPFCGAAGKILDELLESISLKREDIYITNLLKDRPPQNRDPQPEEIKACFPYLEKQIEIIKPKLICPLGRYSMRLIMEKYGLKEKILPISQTHGKVFEIKNLFQEIRIIPLYHPAVATYNPNMKEILKKDFEILKKHFPFS